MNKIMIIATMSLTCFIVISLLGFFYISGILDKMVKANESLAVLVMSFYIIFPFILAYFGCRIFEKISECKNAKRGAK